MHWLWLPVSFVLGIIFTVFFMFVWGRQAIKEEKWEGYPPKPTIVR